MSKVFERMRPSQFPKRRNDLLGDLALVEPSPAALSNQAQRRRERGLPVNVANGGRLPPRKETRRRARIPAKTLGIASPIKSHAWRDGVPLLRAARGGLQKLREVEPSIVPVQA